VSSGLVLVDRDALMAKLRKVFDDQTASVMLSVLDDVASQVLAAGVTREDFSELKQIVAQLAQRMDTLAERVNALAERMDTLTERVNALAEHMNTLAERVDRLSQSVDELVKAQSRTDVRLYRLESKVERLEGLHRVEQEVLRLHVLASAERAGHSGLGS